MNVQELLARNSSAGPASDVEPSELLRILMSAERPSEVLPFPRFDAENKSIFDYRMVVLTQRELDQARVSAERYTREKLKQDGKLTDAEVSAVRKDAWSEIYEDAKCAELLCLAMREVEPVEGVSPKKWRPLFTGANKIREYLTTDEHAALFSAYTAVQFKFGPLWRMLDDAECDHWLEVLEGGAASYPFSSWGQGQLLQLLYSLAFRHRSLKIAIGSAGSQSSESASETTPNPQAEKSEQ